MKKPLSVQQETVKHAVVYSKISTNKKAKKDEDNEILIIVLHYFKYKYHN